MILAGDIGGTKTRLALFRRLPGGALRAGAEVSYPSREHAGLGAILALFRRRHPEAIAAATFGIAGPVRGGRSATTNLPWVVEAADLAARLGLPAVGLINDLEANAWGLGALGPDDLLTLHPGAPGTAGNSAIIAAGTGLGEAGLYWDGRRHHPFATEGGHADFAPGSALEDELLVRLRARHGRVSWERVVSGPGLVAIYEFLRDTGRGGESPDLAAGMAAGDPAAAITGAAREGRSSLALAALDLFVTLYGAEAGNLALKTMATGGVYVGGGIAPQVAWRLRDGGFIGAFLAKGRMRPLMEAMPIKVVMNDRAALLGAARHAAGA